MKFTASNSWRLKEKSLSFEPPCQRERESETFSNAHATSGKSNAFETSESEDQINGPVIEPSHPELALSKARPSLLNSSSESLE